MTLSTPSAVILGLGLIGGSAGIVLRRRGWRVHYIDPHVADAGEAADARVDEVGDEDVVLLATPVDVALRLLPSLATRGVITSTCSVMAPLRRIAGASFVAGHPMAGSQERGLAAARGDLFEGKSWFVDDDDERVDRLIRDCGAVRVRVEAEEHDAAVALTSHLPQVLSTALAAHLAAHLDDREDLLRFAGSGLETFLRLAGSDASVWASVLENNRENLRPHADAIAHLVRDLIEGDTAAFDRARATWQALQARSR